MLAVKQYVEWLRGLPNTVDVRPISAEFGKTTYFGALYAIIQNRLPQERAVEYQLAKAWDQYTTYFLGFLGDMEPKIRKNGWVWKSDLPLDARIESHSDDWYLCGYYDKTGTKEHHQVQQYHPFGNTFLLKEWTLPVYGPYQDQRIDHFEDRKLLRQPLTVTFLEIDNENSAD